MPRSRPLVVALALLAVGAGSVGRPTRAAAQGTDSTPPFRAVSGAFIGLSVADLDASVRWYREKLGLRVTMRPPPRDGSAVAVLEGGGLIVELVQLDAAVPLARLTPAVRGELFVHGMFKAGLVVDDFDHAVATLRARGVAIAFGPFPARDGQRANVGIRDDAGNLIQLFGR